MLFRSHSPRPGSEELPFQQVQAQFGQIRTVDGRIVMLGVYPVLRSTKEWEGKHGKMTSLRDAFSGSKLNGDSTSNSECSEKARQAVKRFEDAAKALRRAASNGGLDPGVVKDLCEDSVCSEDISSDEGEARIRQKSSSPRGALKLQQIGRAHV